MAPETSSPLPQNFPLHLFIQIRISHEFSSTFSVVAHTSIREILIHVFERKGDIIMSVFGVAEITEFSLKILGKEEYILPRSDLFLDQLTFVRENIIARRKIEFILVQKKILKPG